MSASDSEGTEFAFAAELWRYPGEAGWYFVTLPPDVSDAIDELVPEPAGFGSVPVIVTVGSSQWATSVFPDKASASFVLPVKKPVRLREDVDDGDEVELTVRVDRSRLPSA